MKKRVVVTGMEIVSSIGCGLNNFWQKAIVGKCGIRRITAYEPNLYTTQIAGEITDFSAESLLMLEKPKRYPMVAQYALFCAQNALQQSGLTAKELCIAGSYIGTSMGGAPELETAYQLFYNGNWKKIPPLSVIRGMPNSIANHIAIAFGLGGPNSTISNACVSSAEALGNAYQNIAYGRLDVAICGGAESLLWESIMAAWCKLRVMSTQNDTPEASCKPFDLHRDGMVMADGAGILVLEELEHAKARGAKIYGEILGFGASCDASHVTAPNSVGQARAVRSALDDARMSTNDIQYISAHGTGTPLNDAVETATIKDVFGEKAWDIPITAQKAMTGHAIGAAGVMEIIATLLCMQYDFLLPTINLHTKDPACDLDYIPQKGRKQKIDIALSNHFAFGGANSAVVLARY